MPVLDREELEELRAALEFVRTYDMVLLTGLELRAEQFEKSAASCQASYETGEENALITNGGYGHMAGMFRDEVTKTREAIRALRDMRGV